MKLKYYLRGLGIGIAVTTLIMTITSSGKETLTDDEIKIRAEELGMVDEGSTLLSVAKPASLSTSQNAMSEQDDLLVEEPTSEEQILEEAISAESVSSKSSSSKSSLAKSSSSSVKLPDVGTKEDEKEDGQAKKTSTSSSSSSSVKKEDSSSVVKEQVNITITSGESSWSVAKACEAAGLVTSASEFDAFLCAKGYDRRLVTGVHVIPSDATEDEIGLLLTQKQ